MTSDCPPHQLDLYLEPEVPKPAYLPIPPSL